VVVRVSAQAAYFDKNLMTNQQATTRLELLKATPDAKPAPRSASKSTLEVAENLLSEVNHDAKSYRKHDRILLFLLLAAIALYYFSTRSRFILVETVVVLTLGGVNIAVSLSLWSRIRRLRRATTVLIETLK